MNELTPQQRQALSINAAIRVAYGVEPIVRGREISLKTRRRWWRRIFKLN